MTNGLELRAAVELRATGRKLVGYAATFNIPTTIGTFTEIIRPGAFSASLANTANDVLALLDHDAGKVLARRSNGSLRLFEDDHGLRFEIDVPETTSGRDALAMVEARLAGGCSFGFVTLDDAWPTLDQRVLRIVDLKEISIVSAHPAYKMTSVSVRSRAAARDTARLRRVLLTVI